MPNDGGFLLLDQQEKDEIMKSDPNCEKFIHPLLGAQEFIRGEKDIVFGLRRAIMKKLMQYR